MKIIFKNTPYRTAVLVSALMALLVFTSAGTMGCGDGREVGGKMKVAASIVPLSDFCRNVGGGLVEVEVMVPPGASPHAFDPTGEQMKFLSDARVLVVNGLELEGWVTDVVKKVGDQDLVEVVAGDSVPRSDLLEASGEHENGVYDPHVWLDPHLAIHEVEAIRDGLVEADPDNEERYRENAKEYIEKLRDLDEYVRGETSSFTKKKFVSFHPAFTYFARRYGLEQVGSVESLPGKEPSAAEIAALIDEIKEEGVEVVFTEPQFDPKGAEVLTDELGVDVELETLDPIGDPSDPDRDTYIELIRHNVGVMAEVMK